MTVVKVTICIFIHLMHDNVYLDQINFFKVPITFERCIPSFFCGYTTGTAGNHPVAHINQFVGSFLAWAQDYVL